MRFIFHKMPWKVYFFQVMQDLEVSISRCGELIVYLMAIGAFSYLYVTLQRMMIVYLDGLALNQPYTY